MKKTLEVINELKEKGLIEDYAIGGGIASIYYTEPVFTRDLDVFVRVKLDLIKRIASLAEVYNHLENKGYKWSGEHIIIEGVPVQFFVAGEGLEDEAVQNSKEVIYDGVPVRIFSVEYLIAIALRVGRSKDEERVRRFIEQSEVDNKILDDILKKYNLKGKLEKTKG